jgi:hypothetical protein
VPDDNCTICGSTAQAFRLECPECIRRWDELLCRQLRERLFGPVLVREPLRG